MKHKKAKLLRRLVRGGADDAVKPSPKIAGMSSSMTFADSIDELSDEQRDIFFPVLEDLTDELVDELRADGMRVESVEEMREMNLKYNRKRNSFMSGQATKF